MRLVSCLASQPSSPTPLVIIDSIESIDECATASNETSQPLRQFKVLSTAVLPTKRTSQDSSGSSSDQYPMHVFPICDDVCPSLSSTIEIDDEKDVLTLTPRRRTNNETIYNLYQQRLTNAMSSLNEKRNSPENNDVLIRKKTKEQPELVILD
jgi:hypothetical protein